VITKCGEITITTTKS